MGLAAYAYGSPSVPVEAFVQSFLDPFRGLFTITNTECILAVNADSDDDDQLITIRPWPPQQFNLYRLGRTHHCYYQKGVAGRNVTITGTGRTRRFGTRKKSVWTSGSISILHLHRRWSGLVALFRGD